MDWSFLKPNALFTNLAKGDLPTVKTDNEVTVKPETVILLVLSIIIIILVIAWVKKFAK